jgi:hypothetical protein
MDGWKFSVARGETIRPDARLRCVFGKPLSDEENCRDVEAVPHPGKSVTHAGIMRTFSLCSREFMIAGAPEA